MMENMEVPHGDDDSRPREESAQRKIADLQSTLAGLQGPSHASIDPTFTEQAILRAKD